MSLQGLAANTFHHTDTARRTHAAGNWGRFIWGLRACFRVKIRIFES